MASVVRAEPSSVAVLISPTSSWRRPSASRYAGSTTAMKPSAKPRSARATRMRPIPGRCRSSAEAPLAQRRLQPAGELLRIVVRPEVHEEEARLLFQHVAVQCGDFDAVFAQGFEDRVHFLGDQDEITGNRRLAAA